eukprot:m.116000 g.116000  ORF g.116000 m.116000 type:complete len:247 (+) comp14223_c0_seq4:128-868(+)
MGLRHQLWSPGAKGFYWRCLCVLGLLLKLTALILAAVGLKQMRDAFKKSDLSINTTTILPIITSGIIGMALLVTIPDFVIAESILTGRSTRACGRCFTAILHPALWLISGVFGVSTVCLAMGFAIKGLADVAGYLGDEEVFYGLSGNDILALSNQSSEYLIGAKLLCIGCFMAIPAQTFLLSASLQNINALQAANTPYTPMARRRDDVEGYSKHNEAIPLLSTGGGGGGAEAAQSRRRLELAGYAR